MRHTQWGAVTLLAAMLFTSRGWGRLGETAAECATRYGEGKPDATLDDEYLTNTLVYVTNNVTVTVGFHEGRAAQVTYTTDSGWSPADRERLLEANRGASKWLTISRTFSKREDGQALAEATAERLQISAMAYRDFIKAKFKAQDDARLKGF
jgi:hypothetical protein